ncbi:DUF4163 domain-containing protein [Bacillus sp. B15-48]|uniref:PdaC/SigV domain-containing protein n=1 Tax=Bacillus sp. B15-48 TaxID=1548601 RepID=UPI00194001B4|nr:DUF4163 domain-containing protein [Bacillus sp. B15-48]MBM4765434.1 DUF4163 domain-containing protein [Bacillus sp. B15-48]
MNKKLIGKALLVIFTLILSACNGGERADIEEDKVEENKSQPVVVEQKLVQSEYQLVTETYSRENVKVEYPQIVYLKDEGKQQEINEFIKKEALAHFLETMQSIEPDQKYEADGEYEVKLKNDKILSIAYKSYNNISPSAHPYHLFSTTNIDVNTGKKLFLTDFVSTIDKEFINLIKTAKYVGEIESEFEQQIREQAFGLYDSDEKLISALSSSKEGVNGIYAYATENTLGISMPVAHVAGGHAEFEIDISELKEAGHVDWN